LTNDERVLEYSAEKLQGIYDEAGEFLKNPDLESLERILLG